jgi:hypothetical protein
MPTVFPPPEVLDAQTGFVPAETSATVELSARLTIGVQGHAALTLPDQSPAPIRVEERNGTIVLASEHAARFYRQRRTSMRGDDSVARDRHRPCA